ncbi:EAL domain-containing protein [Shinella yambaruensis]|nr:MULTISPECIES: EAL domain-containing protein [Shinella]MCJ8025549.1 EAL domain-containing protein [Shinella yambaruensis]MCO5139462.1 EAL domain-containing protein [Shinella sp.]MCU7979711.1 EAL domain-containing protein [Shinella yambaruensis]MDC7255810.1 EAL domain-containing protein [Shinella sp. YE25]
MSERSIFSNLVRQPDGAFGAAYGPFLLQSALQPIFSERPDGRLQIAAFKGLIRASAGDMPCSPAEFFARVPEEERTAVDGLCRSLHILNAGALGRREAALIINFHAGLYTTPQAIRQEVEWLRLAAHEAGLPPARIACEIREHPQDELDMLASFAARLHGAGFAIAIDNYMGEDRDLARLERLKPQFVTFDTAWLRSFAENSAGLALLRVVIGQFAHKGIRAIVGGIEEPEMIALCRDMGGPLMQGYLLARPEPAPTSFNLTFPEGDDAPAQAPAAASATAGSAPVENRATRPVRQFGRRGI